MIGEKTLDEDIYCRGRLSEHSMSLVVSSRQDVYELPNRLLVLRGKTLWSVQIYILYTLLRVSPFNLSGTVGTYPIQTLSRHSVLDATLSRSIKQVQVSHS